MSIEIMKVKLGVEAVLGGDPQFEWTKNESGLLVAIGTALESGTWQGVDGARIYYPPDVAGAQLAESLNGKPIGKDHPDKEGDTTPNIGLVTATRKGDGRTDAEFVLIDQEEAELVEKGERMLSIEADVGARWDKSIDAWHAYNIKATRVSTVPKGACPTCVIHTTRRTQLAAGDWTMFQQNQPPQMQPGAQQPGMMPQQPQMNPQMIQQCVQALEASGFKVMPPQQQQPMNPQDQGSLQEKSFPGGVKMGNDDPKKKDKKDDEKDIKKPQLKEPTPTVPPVVEPSTDAVPDTTETPSTEDEVLLGELKEIKKEIKADLAEWRKERKDEKEVIFNAKLAGIESQIKERLPAFDKKVWFESVGCDGSPGCAEVALQARLSTLPEVSPETQLKVDLGVPDKAEDYEKKVMGVDLKAYFEKEYGKEEIEARGIDFS